MKTIPNPAFTFELEPGKLATAASLLELCLARPPDGGFDFKTMRARNRIATVLEKVMSGDAIALEDADHAAAVEAVKDMKWGMAHKDLLKFADLFGV